MKRVAIGVCCLILLTASTLWAGEAQEEEAAVIPYGPGTIRMILKKEAGGEEIEISEEYIKEWEDCAALWAEAWRLYLAADKEKDAGAFAKALPVFEGVGLQLSELNPLQMLVKLAECQVLLRVEDVERARAKAFSNYDLLTRIRAQYENECPLVDRMFVVSTLHDLRQLKGLAADDVETIDGIYAHWSTCDDIQIRINALNYRAYLWLTNEPPDLEKAAEYKKEFFQLFPSLFASGPDEAEDERARYSMARDQIDFAYYFLLREGRKDLARGFVEGVEIPETIQDKRLQAKLDEIRADDEQ